MKLINDIEFPTEYPLNRDFILYEDNNRVMFQLKHIITGCVSTARFFIGESVDAPKYYGLSRWDDTGGWKLILEKKYNDKETAINNLMILAKYFV